MKPVTVSSMFCLCLALAACGQSDAPQAPVEPIKIGIYSSAKECAEVGHLPIAACTSAIEKAGVEHDTHTAVHKKLKACEAEAGAGYCEAAAGHLYRARLQAYAVTAQGAQVVARPLYATTGDKPFKDLDGKTYSVTDETVKVSKSIHALAVVINPKIDDGAGEIAEAAANIH